jgi:hypothetical protein
VDNELRDQMAYGRHYGGMEFEVGLHYLDLPRNGLIIIITTLEKPNKNDKFKVSIK